jgi:type I restriction enzyme S subunit
MEVRPGYKQTDVGVIPEDWDAKKVGCEIDLLTGHPFSSNGYTESGVRLLRGSNVKRGQTDWNEDITQYWPSVTPDVARYELRQGDLVIAMDGSLVGRSFAQLKSDDLPALLLQRVARIRSAKLDVTYLTAFVGSDRFVKYMDSVKTVTAIPHISPGNIRNFAIPVPPTTEEQRAIAAALSDVDALLGGLERLIAKKRDLKQAAMQQLLTGQTRLPGDWVVKPDFKRTEVGLIPEDWDVQPFKEQFNISAGGDVNPRLSSSVHDEEYCYPIYSNALANSGLYGFCSYADHPANSITITARGTLGFATYRDHKYTAIGRVLVLQAKRLSAGAFFAEFINSRVKFAIESTGVPQLTAPQIGEYRLAVPPFAEQTAIAAVLSDMDAEISALVARRDKTRDLKQAMMQELLTGRTRLV